MKEKLRQGFWFYIIVVAIVAAQFVGYLLDSQVLPLMDFGGWVFYITSCISHAACLVLPAYLIYIIFCLIRLPRLGGILQVAYAVTLSSLVFVNEQVYQIYRFHINGFVLNMLTGPAAGEIFSFDTKLYAKYIALLALVVVGYALLWLFVTKGYKRLAWFNKEKATHKCCPVLSAILVIVGCTLFAHCYHIYASFYQKQSVSASEILLPYYFPTTSYSLMTKTFHLTPPLRQNSDIGNGEGEISYPLNPIVLAENDSIEGNKKRNILLILIDSWNSRALTEECMPNIFRYANQNQWYQNHLSCSNGTRSGVFGLWFGLSSFYWNLAETSHITPVILDVAHEQGYTFHNYPSAPHTDPPFGRVLFGKEENLRIETEGRSSIERDRRITDDFVSEICSDTLRHKPFLAFLFYDLPHSFEKPEGDLPFLPSWDYADYGALRNDLDPTPFWNLYRNTCHETDKNIGRVLEALEKSGLSENTVVVITGDHSQEFNENHKNYWGHNGNFSWHQIGVPLVVHSPESAEPQIFTHRTTHYDIVPTLMRQTLHVENPEEDYSMGHQLTDTCSRNWHIVGSETNYAFIIQGDTILEKTNRGNLDVYDSKMNIVNGYHFNVAEFNKATQRLNRFIKK